MSRKTNERGLQLAGVIALSLITLVLYANPRVYIPLGEGNMVIAVDSKTDKIIAQYPGTKEAHGLVATPDGEYLVAGSLFETPLKPNEPKDKANSKLYLVHPAHGHVMSVIPVAGSTHHQAITPDGRYVLSTHISRGELSVYDMKQNKIVKRVKTGLAPNYAVISKDGTKVYVTNTGSNNIAEIDLKTWKVLRTLESGPGPEHMVLSKDGKTLYVTNPFAGKVSFVSIASGKVTKDYKIGSNLHGIDLADDGVTLFLSSKGDNKFVALDTGTGKMRQKKLEPAPYHLNTISGSGKVYVSSRKKSIIWVLDQKTLKTVNTIKLPAGAAHQMAIVPR